MGGALLNVNPFGQPGVEAGKNATYALMGREGYETLRESCSRRPALKARTDSHPVDSRVALHGLGSR